MAKQLALRGLKEDLAFVEKQLATPAEPYDTFRLMWEQRRDALQHDIARTQALSSTRAEVALLFNGAPVVGSQEIKLDFATKALENYQAVVASLASERAGAELGSRGRLPRTFA